VTRLDEGRREVYPSKGSGPKRRAPAFGSSLNVSVPISIGLPLLVIGLFLIVAAIHTGGVLFWVFGGLLSVAGVLLFASGKRL
jgi:hypothetical protein